MSSTRKPFHKRWKQITKTDEGGRVLLVGFERASKDSRKAGRRRWLKTPKVLSDPKKEAVTSA